MLFGAFITAAKPFLLSCMTKGGIARFDNEAGQEEVLASCSANVAFDLDGAYEIDPNRLRRRWRGQSIHVDASVVVGDVDLAAIDDGRVELIE